jgi:hypothetical protein
MALPVGLRAAKIARLRMPCRNAWKVVKAPLPKHRESVSPVEQQFGQVIELRPANLPIRQGSSQVPIETVAVVVLSKVAQFVSNHVLDAWSGRRHQTWIEQDLAFRGATAPLSSHRQQTHGGQRSAQSKTRHQLQEHLGKDICGALPVPIF